MQINHFCPYWGCENESVEIFIDKVIDAGYDGIEIFIPSSENFSRDLMAKIEEVLLEKPGFTFIAQQLTVPENETVDAYISKMEKSLLQLASYQPGFINSHTGKDYYSFDDNCRVIEAALNVSSKTGVNIFHETHRGRFSFHASSLLPYLKKFPELKLVGDFSHFCVVSESLLQDQEEIIQQIIPHVSHIHARVGYEQGPQVNDPAAPEWLHHFNWFAGWWEDIICSKIEHGHQLFTITPEFGPAPYMPLVPFTQQPVSNQWTNNIFMKDKLKKLM